jgi:hypothetical protein
MLPVAVLTPIECQCVSLMLLVVVLTPIEPTAKLALASNSDPPVTTTQASTMLAT